MIDRYKMIIWAKSREESLNQQVNSTYNILNKLKEYNLFNGLLLPGKSKKEVKEFFIEKEDIEKLILLKRDRKFPNLGSELLFFTSLDEDESTSINFSVGRSNCKFKNAMTISLPVNITSSKLLECIGLLKDLFKLYNAFYACITSNMNLKLFDDWYDFDRQIPKVFFWINYLGKDIVEKIRISEEIIQLAYEYEVIDGGYYIRVQKEPINASNSTHIELQKKISSMLPIGDKNNVRVSS